MYVTWTLHSAQTLVQVEGSQLKVIYLSINPQVKRLLEDEDEDHLNSSWANPKQLATGLQGLSSVSWKPK